MGGKSANELIHSLLKFCILNTKGIQYIGVKFLGTLIMLCSFNIRNLCFCSSIRYCIAYANEANIVTNKDSPINNNNCSPKNH